MSKSFFFKCCKSTVQVRSGNGNISLFGDARHLRLYFKLKNAHLIPILEYSKTFLPVGVSYLKTMSWVEFS